MDRARMNLHLDSYKEELDKLTKLEPATKKIRKLHQDCEQLCFDISMIDGNITMEELQKMTVYKFYRYKQLLIEYKKPRNKKNQDD